MQRLVNLSTGVAALAVFLAVLGFGISSTRPMPDHAQVFIDDGKRAYIAPPYVTESSHLRLVTARQAYDLKYKPEERCRDDGGFVSNGRSLTGMFLQKIGLLRPLPERWNPDGTWNW